MKTKKQGGGGGREQLIPGAMPRFAQQAPAVEPPSEEAIQTLMVRVRFFIYVHYLFFGGGSQNARS